LATPTWAVASIGQRKLLTPVDFQDMEALELALMAFQHRYKRAAKSFKWAFTRRDLHVLLMKFRSRGDA